MNKLSHLLIAINIIVVVTFGAAISNITSKYDRDIAVLKQLTEINTDEIREYKVIVDDIELKVEKNTANTKVNYNDLTEIFTKYNKMVNHYNAFYNASLEVSEQQQDFNDAVKDILTPQQQYYYTN